MRLSDFIPLIAQMPDDYQAFKSKRSTWQKNLDEAGAFAEALTSLFADSEETRLSRYDLRSLGKNGELVEFMAATILWGYPSGMRGNHVSDIALQAAELINILERVRAEGIGNWDEHWAHVEEIRGLGLSTHTKFLNFLAADVHGYRALILDRRIVDVMHAGTFEELVPLRDMTINNAMREYPDYLRCMHQTADAMSVSAERLEFFLFEFGANLKAPPT